MAVNLILSQKVTRDPVKCQNVTLDPIITIIINIYKFAQLSNKFIVGNLMIGSHLIGFIPHSLVTWIKVAF